jgi:hypothetical protein
LHTAKSSFTARVSGIGVHIAARVAAPAGSGELRPSRAVKDLVAGSGYAFSSRGLHSLKGVPDEWKSPGGLIGWVRRGPLSGVLLGL